MERQTIIVIIIVASLLIIIAAFCIWYFIYRTPKDVVETKNTNAPIENTNAPVNNTSIYAPIDNTSQDISPSDETIYMPVSGIFTKIPVYKITETTKDEDKDVITAIGHSEVVSNPWGDDKCSRKLLFDFAIPLNIKSLRMECKVRTTTPLKSTDAYIVFRNKTTNKTQQIRTTNFSLSTMWKNVSITNTDLLNSGYLREDVTPHPGHEIEIYASACYRGWQINVKGATLIYEL